MPDRPRHTNKDLEEVLRVVEGAEGWQVVYPSGHWGRIRCAGPAGDFTGLDRCTKTVGGTPRSPTSLARQIRTKLRNCPHGHELR